VDKQTADLNRHRLLNTFECEFESSIFHFFFSDCVKTDEGMASNMGVAANVLKKLSMTADKGCSPSLGLDEVLITSCLKNWYSQGNISTYFVPGLMVWDRWWALLNAVGRFGFHKMRGVSGVAEKRLASYEGLQSME